MSDNAQPVLLDYLTKRYGELKLRLARVLRNADLAGDALQDTWLRLQSQEDEGAAIQSPRAYLMRMAANAAVDIQRRHGQSLPHEDVSALLDLADPAPGPMQVVEARSDLGVLVRLLNQLPQRQREVIVLVRWEGMPQKEVARKLGVSLRTVEMDLKRAHDYLDVRMLHAKK
ncbi:RNA polymerase sigma-70 factor (ECF subfamily) [Variovorax sp. 54]|uniref:RNA polymerase sigma factor n=1 Tax=Variovorax sp. 54 TaxID=2035212 RepID=UPI000C194BD4|nr:sigma-70 family RNA polymerase sigma factor [Variovorax sp. 54]PIF73568.1 RNA polymerase sigma-70 factor (ECF subfamily) [Variovorax sp. 54]